MKQTKIIIFVHQDGFGEHNRYEEEFEFDVDTTDGEIGKQYEQWVWDRMGDNFTWYEKEVNNVSNRR